MSDNKKPTRKELEERTTDSFWELVDKVRAGGGAKAIMTTVPTRGQSYFVDTFQALNGLVSRSHGLCCDSADYGASGTVLAGRKVFNETLDLLEKSIDAGGEMVCNNDSPDGASGECMGSAIWQLKHIIKQDNGPFCGPVTRKECLRRLGDSPETRELWDAHVLPRVRDLDTYLAEARERRERGKGEADRREEAAFSSPKQVAAREAQHEAQARERWLRDFAPDAGYEVKTRLFEVLVPVYGIKNDDEDKVYVEASNAIDARRLAHEKAEELHGKHAVVGSHWDYRCIERDSIPVPEPIVLDTGAGKLTVTLTGDGGGAISSELNLGEPRVQDAIESLVLGHACAGVDVEAPEYIEGMRAMLDALANND